MRADFSLLTWPANDGINVSIGNMTESMGAPRGMVAVARAGARPGLQESYLVDFFGILSTIVPSGDPLGTLRLVRIGNTMMGFYLDSLNNWVLLGARSDARFGNDTTIGLGASSALGSFGGKPALVAYDNFQVQYTKVYWRRNMAPILGLLLLDN
jgi:hypothetical protein